MSEQTASDAHWRNNYTVTVSVHAAQGRIVALYRAIHLPTAHEETGERRHIALVKLQRWLVYQTPPKEPDGWPIASADRQEVMHRKAQAAKAARQ